MKYQSPIGYVVRKRSNITETRTKMNGVKNIIANNLSINVINDQLMTFIQDTIENTSLALEIKHFLLSSDFVDLYKSLMFISCLLINDSSLIDFLYCIALMS